MGPDSRKHQLGSEKGKGAHKKHVMKDISTVDSRISPHRVIPRDPAGQTLGVILPKQ